MRGPWYSQSMHGVTTALVAFLFVCVVLPKLVKSSAQYYAGFGLICLIILLDALAFTVGSASHGFRLFAYFAIAVLQIGAICVLFLAAGGISWKELGSEMWHAFEVIRRGEEEKEIIVPLTGEMPRPRDDADEPRPRIQIDEDDQPREQKKSDGGSLPLD